MLNRTFRIARIAAVAAGFAVLAPSAANAQVLNMDMSWGIQSQMNAWNYSMAAANAAAQQYLNTMRTMRANGYTGPSLPTGVTPESLRASIAGMNQAFDSYNNQYHDLSRRNSAVVHDYAMQAIRGCERYDQYGHRIYIC